MKLELRQHLATPSAWMGRLIEEQDYEYVTSTHPKGTGPCAIDFHPIFLLGEHCSVKHYGEIQRNISNQKISSTTILVLRSPKNCFASWLKQVAISPHSRHKNDNFDIEARSRDFIQILKEHNLSILEKRVPFIPVFYDELLVNSSYCDSFINLAVETKETVLEKCRQTRNKKDNTAWYEELTLTTYLTRYRAKEIIEHPVFRNRIKELEEIEEIHKQLKMHVLN
jgi:hypothetical protein